MFLKLEMNLNRLPDVRRNILVATALRRAADRIERQGVANLNPGDASATTSISLDNIGTVGHYQFHGSRRTL